MHLSFILISVINHLQKGIVLANLITLFIYLQVTFVSFVYFSPDGITKFLWPTLSLVTPFHFSFLERFEIIFLSFYLFIIFDSCIPYIFTASDGINQLLNKKQFITYLCFIIRVYFHLILLYPFLLPNKFVARILGNCKLFYRFSIPSRISLIHDTLSALEKEKSLNEALYSFHYTLLSHNLLTGCGDRLDLEKQSISLIYGFDAKAKGKLIVYHVNPIFNEDVEKVRNT